LKNHRDQIKETGELRKDHRSKTGILVSEAAYLLWQSEALLLRNVIRPLTQILNQCFQFCGGAEVIAPEGNLWQ
jgi:hypothetical protein